jgi:hypothetical protein
LAYEQKDNSGTLFKNDKREKDTHPHATGTAMIDGVEYWVSAWTKEGAKGKFQSLAFQPKQARTQAEKRSITTIMDSDEREPFDEVPF